MDARCDIITYCITFYTLISELSRETETFFREIFGFFDSYLAQTAGFPHAPSPAAVSVPLPIA